jgi:hypothetical protein
MSEISDILSASRQAHAQGRTAANAGRREEAAAFYEVALNRRLEARRADPGRLDPAWIDDAIAPARRDETGKMIRGQYHRMPGLTRAEVAAVKDAELEAFYRQQTGEAPQAGVKPDDPEIVTPKQWVIVTAGAVDAETGRLLCKQRHAFQLLTFDQKRCQVCGQVEELRETKALEDTEAFRQLQKEKA